MEELQLEQLLAAPERPVRLEADVAVLVVGEVPERLRQLRDRRNSPASPDRGRPAARLRSRTAAAEGPERAGSQAGPAAAAAFPEPARSRPATARRNRAGGGDQEAATVETRQRPMEMRAERYVVHGPSEPLAVPVDLHDPSASVRPAQMGQLSGIKHATLPFSPRHGQKRTAPDYGGSKAKAW